MKRIPKISDTEWEVMRVIWAHYPITAAEVIARLTPADSITDLADKTKKTSNYPHHPRNRRLIDV